MSVEALTASVAPAHADVVAAIHSASVKTGSDFDYLLGTAMRESGLNSQAKSKGSSATGLYQFIDQTWLGLVKRYGDRHGLAQYASTIKDGGNGHYAVDSEKAKAAILALRKNPELSALMAGEAAHDTKQNLEGALGRKVCGGELYAAHFLGETNARRLIALNDKRPDCAACEEFPAAARANKTIFYNADGSPKTVRQVYSWAVALPDAANAGTPDKPVAAKPEIAIALPQTNASKAPSFDSKPLQAEAVYVGSFASRSFAGLNTASPAKTTTLPQRPLLMSPGVMEILAAMAPVGFSLQRR